jgi:hypothetical protein
MVEISVEIRFADFGNYTLCAVGAFGIISLYCGKFRGTLWKKRCATAGRTARKPKIIEQKNEVGITLVA